jgi:hypothetical protein
MKVSLLFVFPVSISSFQFPKLSNLFKPQQQPKEPPVPSSSGVAQQLTELLQAVSFTNNGKTATPQQQANVLHLVANIEKQSPPLSLNDDNLLQRLDGVWYLQYTSPSVVGDADQFPDQWKPAFASEGTSNIETKQFSAQGTVSAAGIVVDTSNRVVQQILNVTASTVVNNVELDFGTVRVGGPFRASPNVPNRAIVSFDTAEITFKNGVKIGFGFLFAIIALARGSKDNGWLETTFVNEDVRIGRGNKGTMFVLTRDSKAVKP